MVRGAGSYFPEIWKGVHSGRAVSSLSNFLKLSTEHLINSLSEFDITYPSELDDRGRFKDHVTTLSNHRRRRRSASEETGPITYQVGTVVY